MPQNYCERCDEEEEEEDEEEEWDKKHTVKQGGVSEQTNERQ